MGAFKGAQAQANKRAQGALKRGRTQALKGADVCRGCSFDLARIQKKVLFSSPSTYKANCIQYV